MIKIIYPPGGGGTWLSATIANLETSQVAIPMMQKNNTFDHNVRSKYCDFVHYYEYQLDEIERDLCQPNVLMFSISKQFNHYIQMVYKVLYNPAGPFKTFYLGNSTINYQFFKLSDHVKYILGTWFREIYCTKIHLNQGLVFTDPNEFSNELFSVLNENNIPCSNNKKYVVESAKQYKASHISPELVYDNFDNIAWLAWCHALTILHDISVPFNFYAAGTMEELRTGLITLRGVFLEITKPLMLNWSHNEPTT